MNSKCYVRKKLCVKVISPPHFLGRIAHNFVIFLFKYSIAFNRFFVDWRSFMLLKITLKLSSNFSLVLVITCFKGRFGINCLSAFFQILKLPEFKTRVNSKFSKITRVIYPKKCPNQTCGYWLITPNLETHFVLKLISFNSGLLQISKRAFTK